MALNDVLNMIGAASGNINQHRQTVNQAFDIQRDALNTMMDASQSKNAAQGIITMQAASADMKAQNNSRAAATALGNNMDVNTQIVTEISNNMRTASLKASQKAADISKYKNADGIVGGFLGGMYDMLYGQGEEEALQALTNEVDVNAGILQKMNAITLGTASAQNAIKETHTTATLAALQERITAESAEELARLQAEAGKINIQEVNQLMQMDSAQVNLLMSAENAKNAAESRAMMREQRRLLNQEKADKLEAEKDMVAYYNEGIMASGVTDAPPVKSFKDLNQLIKIGDKRAQSFIQIGMRQRVTGVASVATDPLELMQFGRTNPSTLNASQRRIYEAMEQAGVEATSNDAIAAALGLDMSSAVSRAENAKAIADAKKDKPFMEQLMRTGMINKVNPSSIITPGDKNNPYQLPDYQFFSQAKFMDENGFTSQYIKPLAIAGDAEGGAPITFDPSQLVNLGAKAVLDGMPMTEVVDGITTLTRAGIAANNSINNYKWMGLPPQDQANMSVNWRGDVNRNWNGGGKPMTRVTDLADPLDVTTTLNNVLAAKRKFGDAEAALKVYNDNILRAMGGQ